MNVSYIPNQANIWCKKFPRILLSAVIFACQKFISSKFFVYRNILSIKPFVQNGNERSVKQEMMLSINSWWNIFGRRIKFSNEELQQTTMKKLRFSTSSIWPHCEDVEWLPPKASTIWQENVKWNIGADKKCWA